MYLYNHYILINTSYFVAISVFIRAKISIQNHLKPSSQTDLLDDR